MPAGLSARTCEIRAVLSRAGRGQRAEHLHTQQMNAGRAPIRAGRRADKETLR
jgi:hypothetical protein